MIWSQWLFIKCISYRVLNSRVRYKVDRLSMQVYLHQLLHVSLRIYTRFEQIDWSFHRKYSLWDNQHLFWPDSAKRSSRFTNAQCNVEYLTVMWLSYLVKDGPQRCSLTLNLYGSTYLKLLNLLFFWYFLPEIRDKHIDLNTYRLETNV